MAPSRAYLRQGNTEQQNRGPPGRPFTFARLWENWKDPESGEWLHTCTIVTGEPNELVAQIHPRTPVILPEEHHAAWLGETDDGNLKALLVPYPADQMRMWHISPRVNSAGV